MSGAAAVPACTPRICSRPLWHEVVANAGFDVPETMEPAFVECCRWLTDRPEVARGAVGFHWAVAHQWSVIPPLSVSSSPAATLRVGEQGAGDVGAVQDLSHQIRRHGDQQGRGGKSRGREGLRRV
jgi:hypothetical protein